MPDSFWVGLLVSTFCGTVIGLERQLRGKVCGVRTSILICMGTQVYVQLGAVLTSAAADPTRVVGQVMTGIGFLGAGVMFLRGGTVTGVTTAAVIWMLAAIGSVIGTGRHATAVLLAVVTVCVLAGVLLLERLVRRLGISAHLDEGHNERE